MSLILPELSEFVVDVTVTAGMVLSEFIVGVTDSTVRTHRCSRGPWQVPRQLWLSKHQRQPERSKGTGCSQSKGMTCSLCLIHLQQSLMNKPNILHHVYDTD